MPCISCMVQKTNIGEIQGDTNNKHFTMNNLSIELMILVWPKQH